MLEKVELPAQYTTGHEGVDEQHAHLFSILLGIVTVIKNEKNTPLKKIEAEVHELLTALQSYTQNLNKPFMLRL